MPVGALAEELPPVLETEAEPVFEAAPEPVEPEEPAMPDPVETEPDEPEEEAPPVLDGTPEVTVEQTPVPTAEPLFAQGYAWIDTDTVVYDSEEMTDKLGEFVGKSVVYADGRKETDEPDRDPLTVCFVVNGEGMTGFVRAEDVEPMRAEEADEYAKQHTDAVKVNGAALEEAAFMPAEPEATVEPETTVEPEASDDARVAVQPATLSGTLETGSPITATMNVQGAYAYNYWLFDGTRLHGSTRTRPTRAGRSRLTRRASICCGRTRRTS